MGQDRTSLQVEFNALYEREHLALGDAGTYAMLDAARQWDVSSTLSAGGVVGFGHVGVADCGLHVAAAVNACLDTGAETVLAISVLHAWTSEMDNARVAVTGGDDPSNHEWWGIQGPGLDFRDEWTGDHAMRSLRHFWNAETKRRGITGRRLVERYPFLAGGNPTALPNFDEIANLAADAVIVTTADQFHHGIGHGTPVDDALEAEPDGVAAARRSMEVGFGHIEALDYRGYEQHCVSAKSDDRDCAQLYSALRGPLRGTVLDVAWTEAADVYRQPSPTWAAGGFVTYEPVAAPTR
jgi:hypothetical protein